MPCRKNIVHQRKSKFFRQITAENGEGGAEKTSCAAFFCIDNFCFLRKPL
jgi:hypothetical protein